RACGRVGLQARSAQKDTRNSRSARVSLAAGSWPCQGEQVGEATAVDTSRASRRIIERPRLTRLLTESESRGMLLVAPAGYGKTTLAREWLRDREHVWYQATPASSDVAALALGLAQAASHVRPRVGEQLRGRLLTVGDAAAEAVSLANDLATDFVDWPVDTRL